jgi:hypothetical protein
MGKQLKPYTTRKPPVPSESHAEIEDWIRHVMPDLHSIVKQLDESIRETIPGLRYAIKWKKAYYGVPELGWIIEMVAYDVSVNVVFFGGRGLRPAPAAWRHRPEPLRQADDPGGGAGTGDAQVDQASGARDGLEMSPHELKIFAATTLCPQAGTSTVRTREVDKRGQHQVRPAVPSSVSCVQRFRWSWACPEPS